MFAGIDHFLAPINRVRILMQASVGRAIFRGLASEGASAFAGIILRIEAIAITGGLPLLPRVIVSAESRPAAVTDIGRTTVIT